MSCKRQTGCDVFRHGTSGTCSVCILTFDSLSDPCIDVENRGRMQRRWAHEACIVTGNIAVYAHSASSRLSVIPVRSVGLQFFTMLTT